MSTREQAGQNAAAPIEACFEDLRGGAVLVTVNQRLARHHLDAYQRHRQAAGERVWETPAVLPLDLWWRELHDTLLADGAALHARLPDLLVPTYWKRAIEADRSLDWLLDVDSVADSAERAWQLARAWDIDIDSSVAASPDAQAFRRWAARFRAACAAASVLDPASAIDELIDALDDGVGTRHLPAVLWRAGFLKHDARQMRLFDVLQAHGVRLESLDPQRHARRSRVMWVDDERELQGVAAAVRRYHEADRRAQLGVVVSKLDERRPQVMRAFDRTFFPAHDPVAIARLGRPYDVSLGTALADQAVVQAALQIIELHTRGLPDDALSRLLLSPYLRAADSEAESRRRVERTLRDRRVRHLDVAGLQEWLPASSALRDALRRSRRVHCAGADQRSRTHAEAGEDSQAATFARWLQLLGWPGQGHDSDEYQAIDAWFSTLDDLQRLEALEPCDALSAWRRLQRLTRNRIFQSETPARPIRIMGRLESHALELDALWVTGLDHEQWPLSVSPDPFLPLMAQREAGVPQASPTASLALAEAEYALWCRSADHLFLSHAGSRDGHALAAAACIVDIPAEPACEALLEVDPLRCIQASRAIESVDDSSGPVLPPDSDVPGGARLFEDQARCPFKAFATHRLGARALEEAGPGLDPRQHGTLLHEVLEHFWQTVGTHASLVERYRTDTVDDALQAAIDSALSRWTLAERPQRIERARLQRLLRDWLDQVEYPRAPFTVEATEQACTVERGGVAVRLKVDRIDRLDSGQRVMLDYKTGSSNRTTTWSAERIDNPQLPLYALSDDTIDGVCFAQIVRHDLRLVGIAADGDLLAGVTSTQDDIVDWPSWRAHWARALDACAAEISAGHASVTPSGSVCDFCDLKPLCRVDDD